LVRLIAALVKRPNPAICSSTHARPNSHVRISTARACGACLNCVSDCGIRSQSSRVSRYFAANMRIADQCRQRCGSRSYNDRTTLSADGRCAPTCCAGVREKASRQEASAAAERASPASATLHASVPRAGRVMLLLPTADAVARARQHEVSAAAGPRHCGASFCCH
jgi:hypothetical protein